jgi:L-alanine-DL-glutamate epimerase-like enolase superfamily enzyme
MKISKVEIIPYGLPIRNFSDAYTSFTSSDAVLVRLHADNGITGFGEACAWEPEFYGETLESVSSSIQKYIAPKIIGLNPLNINQILSLLDSILAKSTCAKEGIDLALYDLVGKILRVPVYTLLDGCFRKKIPVACEIGINTPEIMAQNAKDLLARGVRVIKVKGSCDIKLDIKAVKAVRKAVGMEAELRLDPNAHWNTMGTLDAMRELESTHLQLLEQPVPAWDLKGMARIRRSISIPLMADESIWTPQHVVEIAEREAADIINIKISKTGGLWAAKKVETVAESVGLPCLVGTELEPGISSVAKLHLAASMRDLPLACEFTELDQVKGSILKQKIRLEDGCLQVPEGFGFGVDLDEEALAQHVYEI